MNVVDLMEITEMMGNSLQEDEEWVEGAFKAWEKFVEINFKEEKERGVFARELDPNIKACTVENLERALFFAFKAGAVWIEKEYLKLEIKRLCD